MYFWLHDGIMVLIKAVAHGFLLLAPLKIGEGFVLKGETKVELAINANSLFLGTVALWKSGRLPC